MRGFRFLSESATLSAVGKQFVGFFSNGEAILFNETFKLLETVSLFLDCLVPFKRRYT